MPEPGALAVFRLGLLGLGLPVVGGEPGPHLAHIVSVGRIGGGRHYTADDPEVNALHQHLVSEGIVFSLRSGVLRFSFGPYNDDSDVTQVLEAVEAFQEKRAMVA